MPPPPPATLQDVTADWLAATLGLARSHLPAFTLVPLDARNSTVARLTFEAAPPGVPATLVLKLCAPGHGFLGTSEPAYYTRDYKDLPNAPILKCYGSDGPGADLPDSLGAGYAVILHDAGATHRDHAERRPDAAHARDLGQALGLLHAHRWGAGADPDGPHDLAGDLGRYLDHVAKGLPPILRLLDLTADQTRRLGRLFDHDAPQMLHRAQLGHGLTLLHGDANPTNVLTPISPDPKGPGKLYLIDRQPFDWSLRLWLGAADLIYASTPFWTIPDRRSFAPMLRASYHDTLIAQGITGYSPQDLSDDWHACACIAAFTALEWGSGPKTLTSMRWLWEPQLTRALALLDDTDAG